MPPLQLIKHHSAWNIPSFDAASLEAELYVVISSQQKENANVTVLESAYSTSPASDSGVLPVAICGSSVYPAETLISDLQSNWYDLDEASLTVAQRSEALTYRTSTISKLGLALMYLEFQAGADSEFAKAVPSFIARKRLQWQRQRTVRDRLRQERILSLDTAVVGATDAFHALSLRLGTNNFFYDKISTLDLTVAAYVTVAAFGYPNQLNPLAAVLTEFYPGLLGHACRVMTVANISTYKVTTDMFLTARSRVEAVHRAILADSATVDSSSAPVAVPETRDVNEIDDGLAPAAAATPAAPADRPSVVLKYKDAALEWTREQIATSSSALCAHGRPAGGDGFDARADAAKATAERSWWPKHGTYAIGAMAAYFFFIKSLRN